MYDPLSTMPLDIFSSHDDFSYVSIFPFCDIYPCHLSLMSPCFTPAIILPSSSISFLHDKTEHALRDRACVHVARPKAYSDLSSCSFFHSDSCAGTARIPQEYGGKNSRFDHHPVGNIELL